VAQVDPPRPSIGTVSVVVLVGYLLALVAMGFYFSRRERTTDDFFLGGRRVPWWAAGLSIFGTQLSAITFLAIPAKTYATDWLYFIQNLGIVAVAPLVVWICLPFYRRLDVTSVYEYLEHRFHVAHRLFGAASFVLFQLARMGIVLYLPALALAAVTGLDIVWCIVAMGVLCTLYTVLGGIEAVIWTDVLQVGVLLGGAATALVVVLTGVDGGFETVRETAAAHEKFRWVDARWDWTGPAIGVILLGAVFNNLVPYAGDQAVVQRYLTTADEKQAARAVWTGALMAIPASLLFFFVGTALFVFYSVHPERLNPVGANDQIFAWFIARELPVGVAGLVIAGVFAAAMSSLDSSMNSIAAVLTSDVYRRFGAPRSDAHYLRFARGITLILGAVGTLTALWLAGADVKSLWDVFLGAIGLLGGTMSGLLILGMISTRANSPGAAIGAFASLAALVAAKWVTELSGLLYAAIGMVTCIVVGYLASLLVPGRVRELTGLTLFTRSTVATDR
ncbi:MAG: sodium:solute symporter, partial [Planctomycetota bacterium]